MFYAFIFRCCCHCDGHGALSKDDDHPPACRGGGSPGWRRGGERGLSHTGATSFCTCSWHHTVVAPHGTSFKGQPLYFFCFPCFVPSIVLLQLQRERSACVSVLKIISLPASCDLLRKQTHLLLLISYCLHCAAAIFASVAWPMVPAHTHQNESSTDSAIVVLFSHYIHPDWKSGVSGI